MRRKKPASKPSPPPGAQPVPVPKDFEPTGIRLKDGQYWKWRLTIEEMQHAATLRDLKQLECKYKELELERGKLELLALREKYQEQVSAVDLAKGEYNSVKSQIEQELGCSLNGCIIDDVTWEVKQIPK